MDMFASSTDNAESQDPRLDAMTLESVELGNEPDYWGSLHRPENWSVPIYLDQ